MGLKETRHISRIAIHPKNPDIVYMAALGLHFSSNEERGLYKTMDGGKTWKKSLFINEKVGVFEVAIDPVNPETVYANTYDKWRLPWHFEEAGPETGIYKSTDDGSTWNRLGGGLPDGKLGRSGLAIYHKNPNIIYATIDNFNTRPSTEAEIKQAEQRNQEPQKRRFGGEVYRTEDAGESWTKMSPDNVSIGGGKWYGRIIVDPNDENVIYVPSTPLLRTTDGGKTWGEGRNPANNAPGVHVDHHTVWINPKNSKHNLTTNAPEKLKGNIEHCNITSISESPITSGVIWVGTDDGNVQITQDGGAHWTNCAENLEKAGAPGDYYVSRVFASNFNDGSAYAVKTGFQRDNFEPLVFKTDDYGVSWFSISSNLPQEIIDVIFEDKKNPELLFLGTDIGVFVTINGGKEWHSFKNNMPVNPVHDLLIHSRENDLVVGSFWKWPLRAETISSAQ